MNIEQMKARLEEIRASLVEYKGKENLEDADYTAMNDLAVEANSLKTKIEAAESAEAILASVETSTRKTNATVENKTSVKVGKNRKLENGSFGYSNHGEYFNAVKNFAHGQLTDQIIEVKNSQREAVGSDGGFLVPTDMVSGIQSAIESDESLLSRTRQLNISGNRASLKINEAAPWTGNGQNITANWVGEGKPISDSKAKFKEVEIKAEKIAAMVRVTDEMMEDQNLLQSFIREETPEVFVAAINNALVSVDGVKKPTGILNSSFGFEVAKEAGQTADTVVFENLKKLHTHALPRAKRNGVYLYNAGVEEELIGMKLDPASTDGVSVYLPNNSIDGAPYGTLWGKPVFPMIGAMPKLGDKGDIIFVDFSYYYSVLKTGGMKEQISTHFYFDTDETAFKYTFRMGGLCPFSAPQGTEYGDYKLSGFTYLAERA